MIKKGSKIKLEFKCKEAGCALKWVHVTMSTIHHSFCVVDLNSSFFFLSVYHCGNKRNRWLKVVNKKIFISLSLSLSSLTLGVCVFLFFSSLHSRWEFRTFDHDIRFGIKRINEQTGEQNIEVDMKRVASHQLDEEGYIACQPDWTCEDYKWYCLHYKMQPKSNRAYNFFFLFHFLFIFSLALSRNPVIRQMW